MNNILISGLINIETTIKIDMFPINYTPIDYKFYGVNSTISGVGYNIIKAIKTLGGNPIFFSIIGDDIYKNVIKNELNNLEISEKYVLPIIKETAQSIILYNENKRKIILDLKDLQETKYPIEKINEIIKEIDIAVLCNINFSRDMLNLLKSNGKLIATDIHVIDNIEDDYNKDFMIYSDILFLSNENISGKEREFLQELIKRYNHKIIVIGMGEYGLLLYVKENDEIKHYTAIRTREVVNTIGAGDALFSSFIYFYNKTKDIYYSIEKAIIFSSYKIGEKGGAEGFLTEKELLEIMPSKYTIEQIRPFVEQFIKEAKIEYCGSGDDSDAFCVNNDYIFKFPKHKNANDCLQNEISLLKNIQNMFEVEIPNVLFEGKFKINDNNFSFFVSKKLKGNNLTKEAFLALGHDKLEKAAKTIAMFLKTLHSLNKQKVEKNIVLLHGDFSLNHILFQDKEVSGILDFADNCTGKYEQDFMYLLDDEDTEEFGKTFGEKVLKYYLE